MIIRMEMPDQSTQPVPIRPKRRLGYHETWNGTDDHGVILTPPYWNSNALTPRTRRSYSSRKLPSDRPRRYQSLTASYKSKLEQFRRIFRGTPVDTDRLLVDYACALSKNNHGLLLQGRMYVTENWICFYSKILYEQKIFLAVKEIIAITKEKTARVIPNAIQILYSKSRERFFFTSFSSRERTYAILRKVWENCRNHQVNQELSMSIDEIMQQVREIYGDDSLALLDDEDTDPDQDLIRRPYNSRSRHSSESSLSCQPNDPLKETLPSVSWPLNRTTDGDQPSKLSTRGTSEGDDDEEDGLRLDRLGSSQTLDHGPSLSDPSQSTLTVGRIAKSEIGNTLVRSRRCRTPDVHSAVSIKTINNEVALCEIHSASQLSFVTERKKRSKRRHARSVIPHDLDSESVKQNWVEKNVNSTFGQHPGNDLDSPASCSDHDHPGRFYLDTETPLSVDALFSCIFTDSEFYDRLCSSRGTFNLVQSPWPSIVWPASGEKIEDTNLPSSVDRTISYTMPLKQRLGPRTCTSVERQTLLINESRPGERYVVDSEVNNQAVPLCSSFYVTIRYCLLRGSRFTSRLRVCSQVVYKKQVFFGAKSIIENTCRSGLTEYLTALTNLLIGEASRFNDNDRLTGGFLAKQSTSTSIIHNGPQAIRSADQDFKAKERTTANRDLSGETASRDGPDSRGQPFRRDRLNQDGDFILPQTAHKVHSNSPSHGAIPSESSYIPYCQNFPFKSITYFFLRPDRAWLLLVLISLLLCLCLSMVYNRVVALEKLAERLSVTSPDAPFGSFGSADSPSLQPNPFSVSQRKDEMTRTKLTAMKELAKAMSNTLTQMQQVLSTVSRSIDLLEQSYASGGTAVESFTGSASAQPSSLPSGPQMTFSDLTHPAS
ncbi:unnamed protein product [Calicophoron daubneyi]|uniref:VASt domain-containing protein n=1 Tax=Calicophoron daubneyi TaxID=300641 RepID=A0AAV2TEX1_CALDB